MVDICGDILYNKAIKQKEMKNMMKKWLKRLILPAVLLTAAGIFALAVAFDFERTMIFTELPPQALERITVSVRPHYGNTENIELDERQKMYLLEALDELETRGISLKEREVLPQDKAYSLIIDGAGEKRIVINAYPGVRGAYTAEGGWFKHSLGDAEEMNYYIYRMIEETNG